MNGKIRISVCLASYNGAKYIKEQIQSILSQLGTDDELIVSDDGSTDGTLDVVSSFDDGRIKVYHNSAPHGVSMNFNNAIYHSSGDVVFLSDQDDIWIDGKVKRCVEALKDSDMVVHNAELVDSNNSDMGKDYFSLYRVSTKFWNNWWRSAFLGSCMAFRRESLMRFMPCPNHPIILHDYWLFMSMVFNHKRIACITTPPLIRYRRHEGTVTGSGEKSRTSIKFKLTKRFGLLYLLIKRYVI